MKHAATILTIVGSIGVIATAVTAAKDSPKANKLIEKAEQEKRRQLTTFEKVKTAAPAYIPTLVVGGATIACVLGANVLNKKSQASLASAYAMLDASYKEYRKKVEELYGEGSDDSVISEIAKDNYEELDEELPDDEQLFFDYNSMQYFKSRIEDVVQKTTMDDGLEVYIISTPFDTPRIW